MARPESARRMGLGLLLVLCLAAAASAGGESAPGGAAADAAPAEASEPAAEAAPPAAQLEDCAGPVVERVQSRYDGVEHLQAGFQQRTRSIALGGSEIGDSVARGRVMFAKPGRMRWSYESPEPSLVVSDGETLWIYDPAAQEVQELPVGQGFLSGTVIQFLLGEGRIVESFDVRAEGCDQDRVRLSLLPRTAATYEYLELLVGARDGAIFETAIVDLFGNRTEMVFEGLRTDLVAPDELFRFVAEPGVRVLRLPPQGEAAGTQ